MWTRNRVMQCAAIITGFAVMLGVAGVNQVEIRQEKLANAQLTVGVINSVNTFDVDPTVNAVSAETTDIVTVSAVEGDEWSTRLMADVNDYLYVRVEPSEDAEVAGKIRKGDVAEITAVDGNWFKITSGKLEGYVKGEYCLTGEEAEEEASSTTNTYATSSVAGLRVREEADGDASILTTVAEGDKVKVNTEAEAPEGWVAVTVDGENGYVSEELVEVETKYSTGITVEEEEAIKKAEEEAARKKAAEEAAKKQKARTVQNAAVAASVDDVTLLAALIQCEAGSECYEGQVAVGAVVMNRVRSGSYPSTISGVIYQSGQFGPARTGAVARVAANGPKASCIQAAQAALSGTDNTGGKLHFRRAGSIAGVVIGNHVFY